MVLDRPGRGDVGRRADKQHPVETEAPRLAEHLAQRPGGQPATARRRPDAVADVAGPADEVAGLVPQRDRPQHLAVFHDPPVRAVHPARLGRPRRIRLGGQPLHPGREPGRGGHLVAGVQPETVLVQARSPLRVRFQPGRVQADGGSDQLGHVLRKSIAHVPNRRISLIYNARRELPGKAGHSGRLIYARQVPGGPWERWRKDVSLVYSRRTFRTSRRRRASGGPGRRLGLAVTGASVPALVVGYVLVSAHSEQAVNTASVSYPAADADAGGWSYGGHTMMPGPASAARTQGSAGQGSVVNAANAATTSQNWAGYASAGNAGTFTSVSASWSQPAVTCTATDTFSSFWVGLDGDGTNSVEQTGTEADCSGGNAVYQGWFEMFPAAPVFYNNPVQPGDAMSASVVANGGGAFTLTLTDSTQGWTQKTDQTLNTAQLGSAEVIAEAPSSGNGNVLPLSNFGTVNFTAVTADNAPIGNENPDSLTMVSGSNVTEATPSALTGGNAFSVTWNSDGVTAAAAATDPGSTSGRHHHHRYWWWGN